MNGEVEATQSMLLLDSLEDGEFRRTMDDVLEDVIRTLHKHHQNAGGTAKGSIRITLKLAHNGQHVMVKGEIAPTLPKPVRGESIYYRTPDNGLSMDHPRQLGLEFTPPATSVDDPNPKKMQVIP